MILHQDQEFEPTSFYWFQTEPRCGGLLASTLMRSCSQPDTPLDGGFVRSPDARSQPFERYRPPEHMKCSAFLSARDKLAVHGVSTDECGDQRMYFPGHRQRILPRTVQECCIDEQPRGGL